MPKLVVRAVALVVLLASPIGAFAQSAPSAPDTSVPGHHEHGDHGARFREKFEAANTTHDGHLTLQQAQAGHMGGVARNFAAIDTQNKGYVTIDDVQAWRRQMHAARQNSPQKM